MAMFMGVGLMPRMVVSVRPVVSRVIVVVDLAFRAVAVFMTMFMEVFVVMSMGVFVRVFASIVGMLVGVSMGMVMAV